MFDLDKVGVYKIEGKDYIRFDYISMSRQRHVQNHPARKQECFILVPCDCGSGELLNYVDKDHLRELLADFK